MTKPRRDVTEAELAILNLLWEGGPLAVRGLADRLYPGGGASGLATVQKLVERLEEKGCVTRDRTGRVQVVAATIGRGELIARRLRALVDDLGSGSLGLLMSRLVEGRALTAGERAELREFLDGLDEGERGRGPGG